MKPGSTARIASTAMRVRRRCGAGRRTGIAAILLSGLVALTTPTQSNAQDVLACVVASGGTPIVGATVVLAGTLYGGVSDSSGCVTLPDVPAGQYLLVVQRAGFVTREVEIVVVGATNTVLDVRLSRPLPDPRTDPRQDDVSTSADHSPASGTDALLLDGYLPIAGLSRTGFFESGRRQSVLPANARFTGLGLFADLVAEHPLLPGESPQPRLSATSTVGIRPIGFASFGSNVGAVRVGAGLERAGQTGRYRFLVANVSGRSFTDGSGATIEDEYVATSFSGSAMHAFGAYVATVEGEGVLVSDARARGAYAPRDPAVANVSANIRRSVSRGYNGLLISGRIYDDGLEGSERFRKIDVAAAGTAERTVAALGAGGAIRGRVGASLSQLDSRGSDPNAPVAVGGSSALSTYTMQAGSGIRFTSGVTVLELDGELAVDQSDASTDVGEELERATGVLPTIAFAATSTRRFGSADVTVRLESRYREWAPNAVLKVTSPTVVWVGQQQIVATPSRPLTRLRSAVQQVAAHVNRRGLSGGIATGHEWLFAVPSVVAVEPSDYRIQPGSGRSGFVRMYGEAGFIGFVSMGVDATLVRTWTDDAGSVALPGTPSSTITSYLSVSGASGYPYFRWATILRLARDRVADALVEAPTPRSSETTVELGFQRGAFGMHLGVANLGNRTVYDHAMMRGSDGVVPAYPGRRLYVGFRLR